MQRYIYILTSILLLAYTSVSCGRRPSYVIPEQKMMDVLYDIQLAQAIYMNSDGNFDSSQKKDALVASILQKYDITQAELDSSLVWYSDNVKIYVQINDSVTARLKARSEQLMVLRASSEMSMKNKTESFLPPFAYLNNYNPTLSFNIDSFKIKNENLSKFKLQFDVQGINNLVKAEAALFFTYKDTLIKQIQPIVANKRYLFDLPQLPDSLLKSISGYLHINNKMGGLPDIMIYNISYKDSISSGVDSIPHQSDRKTDRPNRIPPADQRRDEVSSEGSYLRQKNADRDR